MYIVYTCVLLRFHKLAVDCVYNIFTIKNMCMCVAYQCIWYTNINRRFHVTEWNREL